MLTFRARELGLPTFQSTCHESKIASVTAVKSDSHTFMPYYSIDFNLKRVYQSDEFKVILDAIYAEFGPIPYSSIKKDEAWVGVRFNIDQFVVPGFVNKLAALLQKLKLVSAQDQTALLDFFEKNNDKIKSYIQAGKDCHRVANEKIRLHRLIEDRNPTLDEIEELLKDSSVDVNFQDGYGSTALMKAVKENRADIVKLLLERGADPHLIDWFGDRPLEIASYCDRLEIAELLLNHGADPNLFWGNSAMHNAFSMASDEMVTLLARYGARCDVQNRWGETPINPSINSRHHDNGETVRRRTQIAEKKGRMDLVSYQPETVKQKVVQKKKQTQPVTIGQQLLALSATLSRVVDDSVATELANSMRKINIASKELQHKEYKIWFNACLSLSAKDQASIKPFDSQVNVANVALMKRAFLAWLQSLDNETAIRACAMACNRETVLGRLLYIKCGWLAPSIERGTLKQVNERLQILRQQQMKIQLSPKFEKKPYLNRRKQRD